MYTKTVLILLSLLCWTIDAKLRFMRPEVDTTGNFTGFQRRRNNEPAITPNTLTLEGFTQSNEVVFALDNPAIPVINLDQAIGEYNPCAQTRSPQEVRSTKTLDV